MNLGKTICIAAQQLIFASTIIVGFPLVVKAEQCAFNGKWEGCSLSLITSNGNQVGTRVKWLSDGKVVSYYFFNCNEYPGGQDCKTKIVEDNGRITYGTSAHGGRGTNITSSKGNKTLIPPFSTSNQTQMRDLGYYWKTTRGSDGSKKMRCFNTGNNQETDNRRCKMAEELINEGYKPGD
ncbi:hypothetical protein [Vulcanococcus limneticus]|uniref:hypothetical protein n=1 Tax=Vulcanococcus limneticus TaxID=2170428 RepID=UPI00398C1339